jgi:hypothetical protein
MSPIVATVTQRDTILIKMIRCMRFNTIVMRIIMKQKETINTNLITQTLLPTTLIMDLSITLILQVVISPASGMLIILMLPAMLTRLHSSWLAHSHPTLCRRWSFKHKTLK